MLLKVEMGLKMKNFNICRGSLKIKFLRKGAGRRRGSWETNISGELPKKGGLRQFAEKEGVVILREVDTLMHTMTSFFFLKKKGKIFCLCQILLPQTSNLAFFVGIYNIICCMPTRIARIVTDPDVKGVLVIW